MTDRWSLGVTGYTNPKALRDYVGYLDYYAWDDIDAYGSSDTLRESGEVSWQGHGESPFIDARATPCF